MKLANHTFVT